MHAAGEKMKQQPTLIDLSNYLDIRGQLGVVEGSDLPFSIERVYYIFDVPIGAVRGEHGHMKLQQLMICMNGICEVSLTDGIDQYDFKLDKPSMGILVPAGMWRKIRFAVPDSVLCVLASRPYEPDDYIHSYEDFLQWAKDSRATSP